MIDLRPLVPAQAAGVGEAGQAAAHRAGIHHQVVFIAVEPVSGDDFQGVPQAVTGLNVARDHRQIGGADQFWRAVEEAGERRAGHHRFDAGQGARVGALLDHRQQEIEPIAKQAVAGGGVDQIIEHREPAIEPSGGQRRAAGRAGDTDKARDTQFFCAKQFDQIIQAFAVVLIGCVVGNDFIVGERRKTELRGNAAVNRKKCLNFVLGQNLGQIGAAGQGNEFPDQAAARMADQMHLGPLGQALDQIKRIGERAFAQRAMFQTKHPLAVNRRQRLP